MANVIPDDIYATATKVWKAIDEYPIDHIAAALLAERESATKKAQDKIDGLQADLDSAVLVAFERGAEEWVKLNYPIWYHNQMLCKEARSE